MNDKALQQVAIIDEPAYLVVTKTIVGVTNELGDVYGALKDSRNNVEPVLVIPGYKKELLEKEFQLLLLDEVYSSYGGQKLMIPDRLTDYNLVERK